MRWQRFGVAAPSIRDIIVTHLHYDHAGNLDRFPNARFHLQDREMSYATGRCMCNGLLRHPFSVEHVTLMVRHVYGERVTFHSGDGEVAPGVTVHRVGGHSDGLQVVRVETARGPVVLASDAAHYYANLQRRSPFPIVYNVGDMAQGWEIVERLAGHPDRFIPGHDPIVSRDLSARQRQGRCLRAASAAVALVREIGDDEDAHYKTIGFIGLGVMGEPICRNLVKKSGARVSRSISRPSRWRGCAPKAPRSRARSPMSIKQSDLCSCACPARNTCARCSRATAS